MPEASAAQLLRELAQVASALGPAVRPVGADRQLASITTAARELFGARACSLALLSDDGRELVYTTAAGVGAADVTGMRLPVGQGVAGWVVASGQPVAVDDLVADPRFARDVAEDTGYVPRALVAVPVAADDEVLGVLTLLDRDAGYGGHTSCVAVQADGRDDPTLVLDAGTGLRSLTQVLRGRPYRGAVLLSHLHWDHVQGLPFFAAGDRPDAEVDLRVPAQDGRSGRDLLAALMSPPAFPIEPEGLLGAWRFTALEPGRTCAGGFEVAAAELAHKDGRTFGYRVEDGSGSVAYLPDHAPALGLSDGALQLVEGVDVLVHDAQFLEHERAVADAYGHATVQDAVELAVRAGAGRLVLFHHGPGRTDDALDELARSVRAPLPVHVAREGEVLQAGGPEPASCSAPVRARTDPDGCAPLTR